MDQILKIVKSLTPPQDTNVLWLKVLGKQSADLYYFDTGSGWVSLELDREVIEQILKDRGTFLSNWDSITGKPVSNPKDMPYEYKAGDYYIVSNANVPIISCTITQTSGTPIQDLSFDSETYIEKVQPTGNLTQDFVYDINELSWQLNGENVTLSEYGITTDSPYEDGQILTVTYTENIVNYRPTGAIYTGLASTEVETQEVNAGDSYTYNGTDWLLQQNYRETYVTQLAARIEIIEDSLDLDGEL